MSEEPLLHDQMLAAIAQLRVRDVSARHADRLRNRCHDVLDQRRRPRLAPRLSWRRMVVTALASAWCAVYLCDILLRAATIYALWVR